MSETPEQAPAAEKPAPAEAPKPAPKKAAPKKAAKPRTPRKKKEPKKPLPKWAQTLAKAPASVLPQEEPDSIKRARSARHRAL